jgi:hypothetical protein
MPQPVKTFQIFPIDDKILSGMRNLQRLAHALMRYDTSDVSTFTNGLLSALLLLERTTCALAEHCERTQTLNN